MIGGFLHNGTIGEFGFGDFENETVAGLQSALKSGYKFPNYEYLSILNTLIRALKTASSDGTLSPYSQLLAYSSNIVFDTSPFDLIQWQNPNLNEVEIVNGLRKNPGRGFQTGGSGYINRKYIPADDPNISSSDVFNLVAWRGIVNSTSDHTSGAPGFFFKTGLTNYGWGLKYGVNLAANRQGNRIFYAETNASQSSYYMDNVLESNSSTFQSELPTVELTALALASVSLGATSYINPNTTEGVNITGKRTMINRTLVHNAVNNYLTSCERLI